MNNKQELLLVHHNGSSTVHQYYLSNSVSGLIQNLRGGWISNTEFAVLFSLNEQPNTFHRKYTINGGFSSISLEEHEIPKILYGL